MDASLFFSQFEDLFSSALQIWCKNLPNVKSPGSSTSDVRKLLSTLERDWNKMANVPSSIISAHFRIIREGLNRVHHREPTDWSILNEVVQKSCQILESIQEKGPYAISTEETIKKIMLLWSQVDKKKERAFQSETKKITFEVVEPPNEEQHHRVIVCLSGQQTIENLLSFLADSWDISVLSSEIVSGKEYCLNLKSAEDCQKLSEVVWRGEKLNTRVPEVYESFVQLKNLPPGKDSAAIAFDIENQFDILIPKINIECFPQNQTAIISCNKIQCEKLKNFGFLSMRGVKVSIEEFIPKIPLILYFPKLPEKEAFERIWENTFNFSIAGKFRSNPILRSITLQLNEEEEKTVSPSIRVSGEEVRILKLSEHRLKFQASLSHTTQDEIKLALLQLLKPAELLDLIFFPRLSMGFVHLSNGSALERLLSVKDLSLENLPQEPAPTPSIGNKGHAPKQRHNTRVVVLSPVPPDVDVREPLSKLGIKLKFATLRNSNAYVELTEENFQKVTKLQSIRHGKATFSIQEYSEPIPYWSFELSPVSMPFSKLIEEINKSKKGWHVLSLQGQKAVCAATSEKLFTEAIEKGTILLGNTPVSIISLSTDSKENSNSSGNKTISVKRIEWVYLSWKMKKNLKDIEQEFSVQVGAKTKGNQTSITLTGEKVEAAANKLKLMVEALASAFKRFQLNSAPLAEMLMSKIQKLARKENQVLLTTTTKENSVQVSLLGEKSYVNELLTKIEAFFGTLASDESLNIPADSLQQLKINLQELSTKFEVKIVAKENGVIAIYGQKDSVALAVDHLKSLTEPANQGSAVFHFQGKEMQLFQRYLLEQFQKDPRVTCSIHAKSLVLKGQLEQVEQMKSLVQEQRNKIKQSKFQKSVPSKLKDLIPAYIKSCLKAEPIEISVRNRNPQKEKSSVSTEVERFLSNPDGSKEEVALVESITQSEVEETKEKPLSIEIALWHFKDPKQETKIQTCMNELVAQAEVLKVRPEEYLALQSMKTTNLTKNFAVLTYIGDNQFQVDAIGQKHLKKAVGFVQNYLEKQFTSWEPFMLTSDTFYFFKRKRQAQVAALQTQDLKLFLNSEFFSIDLKGNPACFPAARSALSKIRDSLVVKSFPAPDGDKSVLLDWLKELEAKYGISAYLDAKNQITVTGPFDEVPWNNLIEELTASNHIIAIRTQLRRVSKMFLSS